MRLCNHCGTEKPIHQFQKMAPGRGYKDGYGCECAECRSLRTSAEFKSRYGTLEGRAKRLLSGAKKRAQQKGLTFELNLGDVVGWLKDGICQITGIPFDYSTHSFCPSLDRHNNSEGYTKKNTRAVVWIYNRAKGPGTHEEVVKLTEALNGRKN